MENIIFNEDCRTGLRRLPDNSIDCCVTSPPYYGLQDYGVAGQIGLEETPEAYIAQLADIFREVKRILKPQGTLWLNIGDSYAGSGHGYLSELKGKQATNKGTDFMVHRPPAKAPPGLKSKDLIGIPWMLAFALRADGWFLRQDIIWHKPNPMPESVRDRCTKSHEYIFLLAKSAKYHFDGKAIQTETRGSEHDKRTGIGRKTYPTALINGIRRTGYYPMANKRSVWTVCNHPEKEAHFACFPQMLIADCIKAGCPEGGTVLDPFMGSETTAVVARKLNRNYRKSGLGGINASGLNIKNATGEFIDVVLITGGAIAAAKGIGMLDRVINKSRTKLMGMIAPAAVAVVGVAGAMMGKGMVKSVAKGIAMGGALKVAEKAMNKENLLSGVDDEPLMLPGIGSYGQAALPELSQYSENANADVTTTGNDPQYYMGQPSEVLSGDDEIIAY